MEFVNVSCFLLDDHLNVKDRLFCEEFSGSILPQEGNLIQHDGYVYQVKCIMYITKFFENEITFHPVIYVKYFGRPDDI